MRSFSKIFLAICATLFLMSLVLIALAPTILSTSWGTAVISQTLSRQLNGELTIGNLHLSWWKGQSAEQIALKGPDGTQVLFAKKVESESSLISLLNDPLRAGTLRVIDLKGTIVQDSHGVTNLEDILGHKVMDRSSLKTPVYLENVSLEVRKNEEGKIVAKAVGLTRQKDLKGQFAIDINLAETEKFQLNAQNFPVLVLDQTLAIQNPKLSGTLLNLLGDSLDIHVDQTGVGAQKSLQILAKSPFLNGTIKAEILEHALKIYPNSTVQFQLPQVNVERLLNTWAKDVPRPLKPLQGQLTIDALEYPLTASGPFAGHLKFIVDSNQFILNDEKNPLYLKQLQLALDSSESSSEITLQLEGEGTHLDKPLSLEFSLNLPKKAFLTADVDLLLETGVSMQGQFQGSLIESPLDASWKGQLRNQNSQLLLSLKTDKVNIPEAELSIVSMPWNEIIKTGTCCTDLEGTMALKKPRMVGVLDQSLAAVDEIHIPWNLNPNGDKLHFDFMAKRENDPPEEHLQGSIKIDQWKKDEKIDFAKASWQLHLKLHNFDPTDIQPWLPHQDLAAGIQGNVNAEIAALRDLHGNIQGTVHLVALNDQSFLKTLVSSFSTENDNRNIAFQAKTKQSIGSTVLDGSIQNLFDEKGKLHLDQASFNLQGHVKHFPVGLMMRIAMGDKVLAEKAEAVLGTAVDADLAAEIYKGQGPIRLNVKGLNGQIILIGKVERGQLVLTEPLTASLKVTSQLDKTVLRELIPILGYAVSSENPIELTIDKEGFSLPLNSPSLTNVTIGSATLNLHKINFDRDSQLGKVVALLGLNANTFEVWFTPLYFSLEKGILTMQRTDMLIADNYPLASWGTVDFAKDKLHMQIALSGQALKKAFTVKGLKNSFMLTIPVRGSIDHPHIDTAQVATRISALALQSKIPEGKVIGNIVDVATDLLVSDSVPEPTSPLPWAEGQTETADQADNNWDQVLEQPIKELKKGARSLLKGLLGN